MKTSILNKNKKKTIPIKSEPNIKSNFNNKGTQNININNSINKGNNSKVEN